MKVTSLQYHKVFNLGNYSNEKIGIEINLEENENPQVVLDEARRFVELNSPDFRAKIEKAQRIIEHPEHYNYGEVEDAKKLLSEFEQFPIDNFIAAGKSFNNILSGEG